MAQNFLSADRDQLYLMPPSVADWLDDDHLAWFIVDVVNELDLTAFEAAYRLDGRGGAAYHPRVMVALLVYAYCTGERSSRRIERRCVEDVAYRVASANQRPDHATIARFRAQHQQALGKLFAQVLTLCVKEGLVQPVVVAVDGTRMEADASMAANRSAADLAAEILAEAAATDEAEDEQYGDARGDEMPEQWRRREGRRERIRDALDQLEADQQRHSYETAVAEREQRQAELGRKLRGRKPQPHSGPRQGRRSANITDPDSRLMSSTKGWVQGYNAQAAVTTDQFVVAAEVTNHATDAKLLEPMVNAITTNLSTAGALEPVGTVLADAGYWSAPNADLQGPDLLIATAKSSKLAHLDPVTENDRLQQWGALLQRVDDGETKGIDAAVLMGVSPSTVTRRVRSWRARQLLSPRERMAERLATEEGRALYANRARSIEPVFGQTKHSRGIRRFMRRGLSACDSEWKLIMATHNLNKMWRRRQGMPLGAPGHG